jgi:hypothetical protein
LIALRVVWIYVRAVRIPTVILLLRVRAMVLLMYALVRATWMLMTVPITAYSTCSFLGCLFRVGAILARSHPGVGSHDLPLWAEKRLVDLDELIDQVVESLLVVDRSASLVILDLTDTVSFEILGEHLP